MSALRAAPTSPALGVLTARAKTFQPTSSLKNGEVSYVADLRARAFHRRLPRRGLRGAVLHSGARARRPRGFAAGVPDHAARRISARRPPAARPLGRADDPPRDLV